MSAGAGEAVLADLHSHLVPGVDDGARTLDESLSALGRLRGAGVREIVTTPHIDASLEGRPTALERRLSEIGAAFERLVEAAREPYPDVSLRLGCEIMLDVPDPALVDARFRLGGTRFILVEWPRLRVPPGTVQVVAELVEKGLVPVIAHPERYGGLGRQLALAGEWRDAGAYLQVNHGSLHGRYGREAKDRAVTLLRHGWVDCLASDFHARAHLEPYVAETRAWFAARGEAAVFLNLTEGNPRRIIQDQAPVPVPPLDLARGPIERLKSFLRQKGALS
jgi:protein-tyrosine phosphatase